MRYEGEVKDVCFYNGFIWVLANNSVIKLTEELQVVSSVEVSNEWHSIRLWNDYIALFSHKNCLIKRDNVGVL